MEGIWITPLPFIYLWTTSSSFIQPLHHACRFDGVGNGMAEAACLYSIITRVRLGRLACLGLESSEGSFTPAPSSWASRWSDVLYGRSGLWDFQRTKQKLHQFLRLSPRTPIASLLPYATGQNSHNPARDKEQETEPGPVGEVGTYGFWDKQENRRYSLRPTTVLLILTM